MKPQDILFFIFSLSLFLFKRESRMFVIAGLLCIILSIPLFALRVFFTAQHLIYYAFFLLLFGSLLFLVKKS